MIRRLLAWFLPGGVLLAALVVWMRRPEAAAQVAALSTWVPWLCFGVSALLAARFHRSRLAFGVLLLALTDLALHGTLPEAPRLEALLAAWTGPWLAVSLLLASFLPERGLLTLKGVGQLLLLLLPAGVLLVLARPALVEAGDAALRLGTALQPASTPVTLDAFQLEGLTAVGLFFGLPFVLQLGRYLVTTDPVQRAFGWTLATAGGALLVSDTATGASRLLLALGALLLGLATLEVSYALAYRDELTRLPGRRALDDRLRQLSGRYTLAMVDIDHFKKLNDRHGHDVGDQVLRMVAVQLRTVGGGGRAYRYGGEEFTIVLAGRDLDEAGEHLDELRRRIADTAFTVRRAPRPARGRGKTGARKERGKAPASSHDQLRVTVSIGAAQRGPAQRSAADVLELADQSLYRAKRGGRNRVQLATSGRRG